MMTTNKTRTFFHITQNLLFTFIILLFCLQSTLLNPGFHKNVLKDTNYNTEIQKILVNSFDTYYDIFKKNNPSMYLENRKSFESLRLYVKTNVLQNDFYTAIDGLFHYITGEKNKLPTLSINYKPDLKLDIDSKDAKKVNSAIQKMDSISLDTLLTLLNRTDIYTYIDFARVLFYITKYGTVLLLLTYLLLMIIYKFIFKESLLYELKYSVRKSSIAFMIISIILAFLIYFLVKMQRIPFLNSLFETRELNAIYINKILANWLLTSLGSGLSLFILSKYINRFRFRLSFNKRSHKLCIISLCIFTIMVSWASFFKRLDKKQSFQTIEKALGWSSKLRLLPAKSHNIFNIKVIVLNKKTKKPLKNMAIYLTLLTPQNSEKLKKERTISKKLTDSRGQLTFEAGIGMYMLSTDANYKSENEYVEIDEAGTYIVTFYV